MSVSTHVLDAVEGRPAAGVAVRLFAGESLVAEGVTDHDGRCRLTDDGDGDGPAPARLRHRPVVRRAGPRGVLAGGGAHLRRPGARGAPPRPAAAQPVRLLDLPGELMGIRLGRNQYGKAEVRVVAVDRSSPRHTLHRPERQFEPARRLRRRAHRRRQQPRARHRHPEEHRVRLRPRRHRLAGGVRPAPGPPLRRLLRLDHRRAGGQSSPTAGTASRSAGNRTTTRSRGTGARCGRRWSSSTATRRTCSPG